MRLPVTSQDELGELASGFNRMAGELQDIYATLEQRVEEKSRSIEIKNKELAALDKEMAVSEERNLLAQELHDSIAQSLAFLNIQVQLLQDDLQKDQIAEAMKTLAQIREGVQESYDAVSYTHLDVYKRQTHDEASGENLSLWHVYKCRDFCSRKCGFAVYAIRSV